MSLLEKNTKLFFIIAASFSKWSIFSYFTFLTLDRLDPGFFLVEDSKGQLAFPYFDFISILFKNIFTNVPNFTQCWILNATSIAFDRSFFGRKFKYFQSKLQIVPDLIKYERFFGYWKERETLVIRYVFYSISHYKQRI